MSSRLKLFIPLGLFIALGAFLYRGLSLDPTALPAARIGSAFPSFTLPDLATFDDINQDVLDAKPALLNVWATWCYSCRVEHPFLLELARRGVPIYGLNYKDDAEAARQWLTDLGDPYRRTVFDKVGTLGVDLGVYGAPETYVIDANGVIVHRHVGVVDEDVWTTQLAPFFGRPRAGDAL